MTDEDDLRDRFAAAALTGLLAQGDDGSFSEESYVRSAYRWADVMLRERDGVRDSRTADTTNHDAAPAARARTNAAGISRQGTGETPVTEPMLKEKPAEVSVSEPVAWAVMDGHEFMEFCTEEEEAKGAAKYYGGRIVPLYRSTTLTDAEREAITRGAELADHSGEHSTTAAALRGLLKRLK